MEIKYHVTGERRRQLVQEISRIVGIKPEYKGAPTFAYEIGIYTIDREGNLSLPDHGSSEEVDTLMEELEHAGFCFEDSVNLVIEIPKDGFNEMAIQNLGLLVKSKETLIKKALCANRLTIEQAESTIKFPWFSGSFSADEIRAYTRFISALGEIAKNQKRVTANEKPTSNEKYAFRCFLLRLGFIGSEYKEERKILLSRLAGSSAFKNGIPVSEKATATLEKQNRAKREK